MLSFPKTTFQTIPNPVSFYKNEDGKLLFNSLELYNICHLRS